MDFFCDGLKHCNFLGLAELVQLWMGVLTARDKRLAVCNPLEKLFDDFHRSFVGKDSKHHADLFGRYVVHLVA